MPDKEFALKFLEQGRQTRLLYGLVSLDKTQVNIYTNKSNENFVCLFTNPDITMFDRHAKIINLEFYAWAEHSFYLSHKNVYAIFRFKKNFYTKEGFLDINYSSLFQNPDFIQCINVKKQAIKLPPILQNYFLL
mgnify:CR=1 FL=1